MIALLLVLLIALWATVITPGASLVTLPTCGSVSRGAVVGVGITILWLTRCPIGALVLTAVLRLPLATLWSGALVTLLRLPRNAVLRLACNAMLPYARGLIGRLPRNGSLGGRRVLSLARGRCPMSVKALNLRVLARQGRTRVGGAGGVVVVRVEPRGAWGGVVSAHGEQLLMLKGVPGG